MKKLVLIIGIIVLVYVLVLTRALERHEDHPRFDMSAPIPLEADVSTYEPGEYGRRVLIGAIGDPKSFNPINASETSSTDIIERIFSSLVVRDYRTQELIPSLAKSWEFSEDNLELTFHLRRGITWSDGVPFSAYDAEFTYRVIYDDRVENSLKDIMRVNGEPFVGTAIDSLTFKVTIQSTFAPFLLWAGGAVPILPRHILEPELEKGIFDSAYNISWPPEKLITCGPYLLEKFESGVKTVLRRNPTYWRVDRNRNRLPYLERIIHVSVMSTETELLMFQTGNLDMMTISKLADVPILERDAEKGDYTVVNLGSAMSQNMFWFNLNPEKKENGKPYVAPHKLKWFKNVKFRKAMAHAVDREGIARTVWSGLAVPQYGPETAGNKFWHNPNIVKYEYNLDKSREYLDSIGFIDRDGDGIREDPDGNKIEFTMITNTGNDNRDLTGNIIKDDLSKIGVKMNFNPIEFNTLVLKIHNEKEYECCLLGLTSGVPDPSSGMSVWLSEGRMHQWYPNQKEPATDWEARIDKLMNLQMSTLDRNERKEYFDEVQYIISDMCPFIYIVTPQVFVAYKNKFQNMSPSIMRHRLLWNIEEVWTR